jgi:mannose-6-phosphate isomerase
VTKILQKMERIITIEPACARLVRKPWGSKDILPWSEVEHGTESIGELWFERGDDMAPDPLLLLKLLFANETLSVQVHPDDVFAKSIGLPRGKTEAWYILSATPDAKVAVGLKQRRTPQQLRTSIEDGSIATLLRWHHVQTGDVVFVPAGTIHSIGPGLVLAEIQQNSDATFRMFDFGRQRELHVAEAVAVARPEPANAQVAPSRLTDARTLLLACPYFVLERIDLAPGSGWELNATGETWLLVLDGSAQVGAANATTGAAFFVSADNVSIATGLSGLSALVAYVATEASSDLLVRHSPQQSMEARS